VILRAESLRFAYGPTAVLEGVDLQVAPGIAAIIGPNAAGKSTLLKCLSGFLRANGRVLLDDHDVHSYTPEQRTALISYLPQDFSTRARLTVFETVLLGRLPRLGWRVHAEDVRCVETLLEEMGLSDLAGRNVGELSGGQLQLTTIAQALVREPSVLLMDEPTSSLDLRRQFAICLLIRGMSLARGMGTVMALHDLNVAARFADTIHVLQDGRIVASGPPAEVLTEKRIAEVYRIAARVTLDPDGRPMIAALGVSSDARPSS